MKYLEEMGASLPNPYDPRRAGPWYKLTYPLGMAASGGYPPMRRMLPADELLESVGAPKHWVEDKEEYLRKVKELEEKEKARAKALAH